MNTTNCNDMMNTMSAKVISIYSSDTSGVCSALYELGGMVVVHDASGCNSTYATHDEPRWYDRKSMIYISALNETDAIMGNDEKFISDICKAAKELAPKFICICGSPMPAMIGTDFVSAAEEIKLRTGIKTFCADTNGTFTYLHGAGQAFRLLAENFCQPPIATEKNSVNIIGATPLDFSINTSVQSIKALLEQKGLTVKSCFAMGCDLDEIKRSSEAEVSLVISSCGIPAAEYLWERFGIPYVIGVPLGVGFSAKVISDINLAAEKKICINSCKEYRSDNSANDIVILGESVFASSLAAELGGRVISTVEGGCEGVLNGADITCFDYEEERLEKILCGLDDNAVIIADPLFKPICGNNKRFIPLPQVAFSGRCFLKDIPDLIGKNCAQALGIN
ncbi:nitrogenase component 1 [Ruminococcus sp.]|uniref:nitrogenase component 1 n=1 Tax=Ruminococcus sp. TaxID=41978 RepID=UPI0025DDF455|nr:nitrogenase component 1 [Ruminococcus sp.]